MNQEQQAARDAAKQYFGCDEIDEICIPEYDGYLAGFRAGYAARDAEDAWVAVSDRLPERKEGWDHTEQCLVKYRATIHSVENHGIAYYHYNPPYDNSGWIDFAHLGRTPIAWMPIPKYQRTEGE